MLLKPGVNHVLILSVQWLGIEFKKDMQHPAASIRIQRYPRAAETIRKSVFVISA